MCLDRLGCGMSNRFIGIDGAAAIGVPGFPHALIR